MGLFQRSLVGPAHKPCLADSENAAVVELARSPSPLSAFPLMYEKMLAIGKLTGSRHLTRIFTNPWPNLLNAAAERVNSAESAIEHSLRRGFHSAAFFSENMHRDFSSVELYNRKYDIQNPPLSKATPTRFFSSEAEVSGNDSAGAETVKGIYDKMMNSVVEKRSAPPNAWLWSLIAKCSSTEDIKLLFDILQKLRTFRLSNLRIPDGFNSALCRDVTKACVRAGAIDFGKKALWKNNLFGLVPEIGSAHQLLLHAKQHNDVKLMVEVMQLVKKNDLPLQPGTADIVFSICCNAHRWDLISKYGKRFVKSGVSLRQTAFELWMGFASRKGDVESLWKIENWRSQAMKQHSISTGFSCAKGFLLEHKPENAAAIIQVLYQTLSDVKRPTIVVELQKLVSEWPLEVIKHQTEENKKAFAAALQTDISGLISALPSLGVKENVTMLQFS